jgi:hypothetical protein
MGPSVCIFAVVFVSMTNGQDQYSLAGSSFCIYDDPRPYYVASCTNASVPNDLDFTGLPDSLTRLSLANLTIYHTYSAISPGPNYLDLRRRRMIVHFSELRYLDTISNNDTRLPFERILKNIASIITSLTIEKSYVGHLYQSSFEGFLVLIEVRFVDCWLQSLHPRLFYPLAYSNRPSWLSAALLQPGTRSLLQRLDLHQNKLIKFDWEILRPIAGSVEVRVMDFPFISNFPQYIMVLLVDGH